MSTTITGHLVQDPHPADESRVISVDPAARTGRFRHVQDAFDYAKARATSADPFVVRLLPGVYTSDKELNLSNAIGVHVVGYGRGISILRASTALLDSGVEVQFLRATDTIDCVFRGFTVDALTNDPGDNTVPNMGGALVSNPTRLDIDSCEFRAFVYGLWSSVGAPTHRVRMFNSVCKANRIGLQADEEVWLIFASELRGEQPVTGSGSSTQTAGLSFSGGPGAIDTTLWGCHVHGESKADPPTGLGVRGINVVGNSSGVLALIATTIHLKTAGDMTAAGGCVALGVFSDNRTILVGCDLLLETGTITSAAGDAAGILIGSSGALGQLDITGTSYIDLAGSTTGVARRGAIVHTSSGAGPVINMAGNNFDPPVSPGSTNTIQGRGFTTRTGGTTLASGVARVRLCAAAVSRTGTAAFDSTLTTVTGTGTLFLSEFHEGDFIKRAGDGDGTWTQISTIASDTTLTLIENYRGTTNASDTPQQGAPNSDTQPNASYRVQVTAAITGETFGVSAKHSSGFLITSSNGASTATVDWLLVR